MIDYDRDNKLLNIHAFPLDSNGVIDINDSETIYSGQSSTELYNWYNTVDGDAILEIYYKRVDENDLLIPYNSSAPMTISFTDSPCPRTKQKTICIKAAYMHMQAAACISSTLLAIGMTESLL